MRLGPRPPEEPESQTANSYTRAMDAALEADPPVIEWEQRHGIQVAVSVRDPHTTVPNRTRHAELTYLGDS